MDRTEEWIKILRRNGCRITAPRRAILDVITTSPRALQPGEVYELCRQKSPGIGLVTVYRTLDQLEALGLIQRIHREDGCHMLMPAPAGHEHYLVCTGCGLTILFKGDELEGLFSRVEEGTGFQAREHWLQLFGTCPQCRENESPVQSKIK